MSNKIVDGVELLRMIRDGEIEKDKADVYFISDDEKTKIYLKWFCKSLRVGEKDLSMFEIMNFKFEVQILEKEIDIQAIEEIDLYDGLSASEDHNMLKNRLKINTLIKAIKQLDKKIK